jgi:hypothetical protein
MQRGMAAPFQAFRMALMLAVGLAAGALGPNAPAARAAPVSLREALLAARGGEGRVHAPPVVGRYQSDDGGFFVLDRAGPKPLLKFDDSPEIWVLASGAGPRGDTIYRNDLGEPMVRTTKLGGMTIFTDKRPDGSAAAFEASSSPLRIQPLSPVALYNRFYQASVRATRAAQHQVGFETRDDAEPTTAALFADAAMVASQALVSISARPEGKQVLSRIADVMIAQGPKPGAALQRGVLTVIIVPSEGVAGRPSSRRIERAAGAH